MRTFEPDAGAEAEQPSPPLTAGQKLFRVGAGLLVAASFGVWAYAYSGFADRERPDLLADRDMAAAAETICAAGVADVAALPNAIQAADEIERAAQIRQATDRFEVMVSELATLTTVEERDNRIFNAWLSDWQVILNDRRDYADRLQADPNEIFLITDTGVAERLDKRITRFANTNLMTSCASPADV
ncbi:MAG: hypothetical protein ACRBK7_03325 [Acidimicrobiales bacterium]